MITGINLYRKNRKKAIRITLFALVMLLLGVLLLFLLP
jgi:hypothetical protein